MAQTSAEKLGLTKRKEWPKRYKVSSWQGRHSRLCQKDKEQGHQSRSPDREVGENQSERELRFGER